MENKPMFSIHCRADENYVLDCDDKKLIIWNGHFEKNQLFKCDGTQINVTRTFQIGDQESDDLF